MSVTYSTHIDTETVVRRGDAVENAKPQITRSIFNENKVCDMEKKRRHRERLDVAALLTLQPVGRKEQEVLQRSSKRCDPGVRPSPPYSASDWLTLIFPTTNSNTRGRVGKRRAVGSNMAAYYDIFSCNS